MHVAVMIRLVKLTHSFAKVDLLAPLRALTVGGLLGLRRDGGVKDPYRNCRYTSFIGGGS